MSAAATPRDRPLLMSGPLVQAILREIEAPGTGKTQHRVPLKPQPDTSKISPPFHPEPRGGGAWVFMARDDFPGYSYATADFRVPWRPGMRAWVRETWATHQAAEPRIYAKGDGHPWGSPIWRASFGAMLAPKCEGFSTWRPSIHMPRWASRLTLLIDDVRAQRLQDISEEDARAEGCVNGGCTVCGNPEPCGCANPSPDARDAYAGLWNAIHGPDAWARNGWIVALTFRPVLANIDSLPPPRLPADGVGG